MKKNFGSAIVKKAITVAMAVMLLVTTPVTNVFAEESETTTEVSTEFTAEKTDAEKEADKIYGELLEADLSDLKEISHENQHPNDWMDKVTDAIIENTDPVIKDTVQEATDAANTVTNGAAAGESIGKYTDDINKATNDDHELIGSDDILDVDKITYDPTITYNPETKENPADIIINVEDENGNKKEESLYDYTVEQKDNATKALDAAKEAANSVNSSSSAEDIAKAQKELQDAKDAAQVAVDNAETAYDSAVVALDKEIALYNAYVAKYFPADEAEKLFKADSKGNNTQISSEELEAYLNKSDIETGLSYLQDKDKTVENLSLKIDTAQEVVDTCSDTVNGLRDYVYTPLSKLDSAFIISLKFIQEQTKDALKELENNNQIGTDAYNALNDSLSKINAALEEYQETACTTDEENSVIDSLKDFVSESQSLITVENVSEGLKNAVTGIQNNAKALLDWYMSALNTNYENSQYNSASPHDIVVHANEKAQELLNHFVKESNDQLNGIIDEAKVNVSNAQEAYDKAYESYSALRKEYETYSLSTLDAKFATLKTKLDAAEQAVKDAAINLADAKQALADAEAVQISFNEDAKDLEENISNATTTTTTTTVNDTAVAMTAFISDEATPLSDMVTITDEPTALLDSVPQTGDSMPAALPVAATGIVAMAGAMFLNLKKRFER